MNSTELINKFFKFEKKHKLFDLRTQDGIYWWDVVRFHIYYEILSNTVRQNKQTVYPSQNKQYKKIFRFLIKDFFYFLQNVFKKNNYCFFLYPRNMSNDGFSVDNTCNDALQLLVKESFLVDGLRTNKMRTKAFFNIPLLIFRKLFRIKNKKYNLGIEGIDELFYKEFNFRFDFQNKINYYINIFKADIKYYHYFFSFIKPKVVFMWTTGNEKGLIYACHEKGIKIIEIQHGQINYFHPYYSYPKEMDFSNLKTVPYGFLSFSSYWHQVNYPVKVKVDIGSSAYNLSINQKGKNVLIVTHTIYMKNLLPLIKKLSINIDDRKIIVKLHPTQRSEVEDIKKELEEFRNIEVIFNEKNIIDVFKECSSMITIQSTVVYEALQSGIKVFLYKKQDYDTHNDLFSNKNLYLVDNTKQILEALDIKFSEEDKLVFFDKFDKTKFLNFIENLK